jgi:hypothetical protein
LDPLIKSQLLYQLSYAPNLQRRRQSHIAGYPFAILRKTYASQIERSILDTKPLISLALPRGLEPLFSP